MSTIPSFHSGKSHEWNVFSCEWTSFCHGDLMRLEIFTDILFSLATVFLKKTNKQKSCRICEWGGNKRVFLSSSAVHLRLALKKQGTWMTCPCSQEQGSSVFPSAYFFSLQFPWSTGIFVFQNPNSRCNRHLRHNPNPRWGSKIAWGWGWCQAESMVGSSVLAVLCFPWHAFCMCRVLGALGFVVFKTLTLTLTLSLYLIVYFH